MIPFDSYDFFSWFYDKVYGDDLFGPATDDIVADLIDEYNAARDTQVSKTIDWRLED